MTRRFTQLLAGLILCGFAIAAMVRANLGLGPWDVFHQGVAQRTGLSIGAVFTLTSLLVLALWLPLRQKPGIGTVTNMILVGIAMDVGLWMLPEVQDMPLRVGLLMLGIAGNGIGASIYLGAGLGPGARDGLMTGLASRYGWPIHAVRTSIELTALGLGWLCGGTAGIGTIAFALLIGPVVHISLPWFDRRRATYPDQGANARI